MSLFGRKDSLAGTQWVFEDETEFVLRIFKITFTSDKSVTLTEYGGSSLTGDEGTEDTECTYVYNAPSVIFTNKYNGGREEGKIDGNKLLLNGCVFIRIK